MSVWSKLNGTQTGKFILGLLGVTLKNDTGNLIVRNNADTANASVTAKKIQLSDDAGIILNSDAAGSGADWKTTIARPTTGQTADITLTLPATTGSPTQVLTTDGDGILSWTSANTSVSNWTMDTTDFQFSSATTVSLFTLPANAVVERTTVIVDTAFDGTPSLSVGVLGGNASKYVGSGDVNLLVTDRYDVPNQSKPIGTTEALEISYTAGSSTVGAGRVIVNYAVPV